MDLLFGGGGGQSSQLSLAAAGQSAAATTSYHHHHHHHHHHDLDLISAAAATSATSSAAPTLTSAIHFNGHDNGPILYDNLNRTSAIDDIRSVVIYIFILTIFLSFFLILPGIRNEKFPTFLCITTSLLVSSIIIISLNGTTWHVAEAPISAPYKAFSRDRIQGDLSVRVGLHSVNISLKAHKYYILHATNGPMMMENVQQTFSLLQQPLMMMMMAQPVSTPPPPPPPSLAETMGGPTNNSILDETGDGGGDKLDSETSDQLEGPATSFINQQSATSASVEIKQNLADELMADRGSDGRSLAVDTELEVDEPFTSSNGGGGGSSSEQTPVLNSRRIVRASSSWSDGNRQVKNETVNKRSKRQQPNEPGTARTPRYTIKRLHVDINYNERFYWIGPMQMRQEYQSALERGLPYPILTCVEYLSQDEAGFNWSRQYRAAGYYTSMLLWVSASVCVLMFCLHCAAPKYGIYAMQTLGLLLLATNLTYATLVPRGDRQLVIPFEGQSVTFRLGWNFWLVLVGGCLALLVGTTIVIIDKIFPNFIFTTVLDVNFDSSASQAYFQKKKKKKRYEIIGRASAAGEPEEDEEDDEQRHQRAIEPRKPKLPPFMRKSRKFNITKHKSRLQNAGADEEVKKVISLNPIDINSSQQVFDKNNRQLTTRSVYSYGKPIHLSMNPTSDTRNSGPTENMVPENKQEPLLKATPNRTI